MSRKIYFAETFELEFVFHRKKRYPYKQVFLFIFSKLPKVISRKIYFAEIIELEFVFFTEKKDTL